MSFNASNSAIVHGFQAFYYELLRQKERALSLYFSSELSLDPEVNSEENEGVSKKQTEIEGAIVVIQKKLINVIQNATDSILANSRIQTKFIDDAKYIMTILADETFLNMRWDGSKFWRFSLLEKQLFQSEVAGEKFFKMADEIISNVNNNEDMAFLFLMSLSLGFKGRYRDIENSEEYIVWYKDRFYSMLHSKPSRLFYPGRSHMIESCYEYTNTENNDSGLPDARFWSWCILGVIFIYIIISYGVWYNITDEIGDVLHKIAEQTRQGPLI